MKQKQPNSIDSYLTAIIEESMKSTLQRRALQEKEKQDATASKVKDTEVDKLKKKVEVDDVIEKLNSIRSGKSFKDEKILASLTKYFDELEDSEKFALAAFLKGISQIVTGEIEGQQALDPGDKPFDIEMKKSGRSGPVTLKPKIVKSSGDAKEKSASSKEDTSGPVPIKPKK